MSRLLLLEDDVSLIDGLRYSLEKDGFELEVARTVREARVCLKEGHSFDLLLLDVTLPDGTGFMICEEVRSAGDTTPIIFLTASDEETSIIRGLDSGGTTISRSLSGWENSVPASGRCSEGAQWVSRRRADFSDRAR